jgi:transcriptional regulator with XRE-family HTH domain
MDAASELRLARRTAGLSQRELARRAGTSQATLSAYEAGRKQPSLGTLQRLLSATGAELAVRETPGRRTRDELEQAGRHLAAVLALAEALPFRRPGPLRYPLLTPPVS